MAIHFLVPVLTFVFNLFFAALGLHCSAGISPVVMSRLLFVVLCKLLLAVVPLVVEHRL